MMRAKGLILAGFGLGLALATALPLRGRPATNSKLSKPRPGLALVNDASSSYTLGPMAKVALAGVPSASRLAPRAVRMAVRRYMVCS